MEKEKLVETLVQIKALVDGALKAGSEKSASLDTSTRNSARPSPVPSSLPEHLIALRDRGFFKQAKTHN